MAAFAMCRILSDFPLQMFQFMIYSRLEIPQEFPGLLPGLNGWNAFALSQSDKAFFSARKQILFGDSSKPLFTHTLSSLRLSEGMGFHGERNS